MLQSYTFFIIHDYVVDKLIVFYVLYQAKARQE